MLLSLLYICPKFYLFFEALFKLPSPLGEPSTTLVPPAPRPVLLNPLCFHPGTGLRWPEDACLVHWPWCVRRPHCLCVPTPGSGPGVGQVRNIIYRSCSLGPGLPLVPFLFAWLLLPTILQAAAKTPLPVGTFSDLPDPGGGFPLPVFPSAHYHGITGCYTELREGSNTGAAKIEQAP